MTIITRLEQSQARHEENGQKKAKYGGAEYRKGYEWPLKFFLSMFFWHKICFCVSVHACSPMSVAGSLWWVGQGSRTKKIGDNSKFWKQKERWGRSVGLSDAAGSKDLITSCKGTPDKQRWEQTNTVCCFVHQKWAWSLGRSVTCTLSCWLTTMLLAFHEWWVHI